MPPGSTQYSKTFSLSIVVLNLFMLATVIVAPFLMRYSPHLNLLNRIYFIASYLWLLSLVLGFVVVVMSCDDESAKPDRIGIGMLIALALSGVTGLGLCVMNVWQIIKLGN